MSESAFPIVLSGVEKQTYQAGLTKRELFAAMAMMNLQNVLWRKSHADLTRAWVTEFKTETYENLIAKLAVEQADALIAELEKEKT